MGCQNAEVMQVLITGGSQHPWPPRSSEPLECASARLHCKQSTSSVIITNPNSAPKSLVSEPL